MEDLEGSVQFSIEASKATKSFVETQNREVRPPHRQLASRTDTRPFQTLAALERARGSLRKVAALQAEADSWRKQCTALQDVNATLETDNGHLYDAFNEELDGMYDDVHQPEGSAMQKMIKDVQAAKAAKVALSKELAYA